MSAASHPSAQLPRPGDMIAGKYVLDRLLGQGGMGAVFAARHVKLSKPVAIKIMLADTSNPEASTRFINEGRAAANIQNEHVVRVDDVDEERGYAYMVLELLEGEDLSQILERELHHRLQPHVAVGYVLQALKGVAQAHAIGIVHRDLKPSNLFLAKRKDGSVVVKVLDFGISKAQGSSALAASPSALTSTKAMLGSPLYMSPEQLRSSKNVDHRADIWGIGVILYELITGELPFMGETLGELFAAILETDPFSLRRRVEGVHPGLDEIVLKCLARRPESRFQSAEELAGALAVYATPQPALGSTALVGAQAPTSPMSAPGTSALGAMTPSGGLANRPVSQLDVATSSGHRAVGGTVALGAITPQNMQSTHDGWQSTGGAPVSLPKAKTPLVVGLAAGAFVVAATAGVLFFVKSRQLPTVPTSSGSSGVVAPSASTPSPTSSLAAPTAGPEVTAAGAAAAVTSGAPSATAPPIATFAPRKSASPSLVAPSVTAKVDTSPKAPETKPSDPKPTPTKPSSTSGGLQNAR